MSSRLHVFYDAALEQREIGLVLVTKLLVVAVVIDDQDVEELGQAVDVIRLWINRNSGR